MVIPLEFEANYLGAFTIGFIGLLHQMSRLLSILFLSVHEIDVEYVWS